MPAPDPALHAFLRAEQDAVVAAIVRGGIDRASAEDAVQEALIRFLTVRPAVDNLAAWITVVARNIARDRMRSLAAERRAQQRWAETRGREVVAEAGELLELRLALASLPERQRAVCARRYLAGWSVAEIAADLGVTAGTVKTQLHRARRRLGVELAA